MSKINYNEKLLTNIKIEEIRKKIAEGQYLNTAVFEKIANCLLKEIIPSFKIKIIPEEEFLS